MVNFATGGWPLAGIAGESYRFGPFEVNAASGELLKAGRRVRLQEQPFRILVILLESAGEIVTRAELQKRIWPANTFVEFDSSLRVAVGKLREALGDDAENPHYIETVPKRGYRFLGPAARSTNVANQVDAEQASHSISESAGLSPTSSPNRPPGTKKPILIIATVAILFMVVGGAAFLYFPRRSRAPVARDSVVIADFANSTGDPVFDETLRQGLAVQLEQSPLLGVVSEERIQQELKFMGRPLSARLTVDMAREICERTASAAVLDGSIASLGGQYVIGLRATDCRTGQLVAHEQIQAARKEDVLKGVGQIAIQLRSRMGESLATVEKHETSLPEATTSSLEALKAYSIGLKVAATTGDAAALPFFKRATEIDPQFAMGYAQLGLNYGAIGESDLSAKNTSKAYELKNRASDAERFFIIASYDSRVTGNLEKAQQTCEAWAQAYPHEVAPHVYLAAFIYPAFGNYEQATKEAARAIDLAPEIAISYSILAYYYVALGRFAEAEDTLRKAAERKLETLDYKVLRYTIAFLKGDIEGMKKEVLLAEGKSEEDDSIISNQAFALSYTGRLLQAETMSRRGKDVAQQSSHKERAALFESGAALWQALYGNATAARSGAMAALKLSEGREVLYGAALALALSGDSSRSQTIVNDLERRFPEDTAVRFSYVPTVRAFLALNHGLPLRAIELLQITAPYELGTQRSSIHGNFGALYPIYARGEAYLAAHQGDRAAAEFQKILDHPGIVLGDPVGALAHLQLGRAYAMQGDTARAQAAYESFLTLWKNADSGIPILIRAKREYAALK